MMNYKTKVIRSSTKFTLIFLLFISVLIVGYIQRQHYNEKKERCNFYTDTASMMFHNDLNNFFTSSEILKVFLIESKTEIKNFETFAKKLIQYYPAIECIQLAPAGIVSKSYPCGTGFGGGELLFEREDTQTGSDYAFTKKQAFITKPVHNKTDDYSIFIQQPVFTGGEDGNETFWGFIVTHLNTGRLFKSETLDFLDKNGYFYRLTTPDAKTDMPAVIAANTEQEFANPCEDLITISNSLWQLKVVPKDGWFNWKLLVIELAVAILTSCFIAFGIGLFISIKNKDLTLETLSFRDTLTSLYNARKFYLELSELQRKKASYSLIYLDVNDFKLVNDNYGHEAGDKVLIILGRKLANCIKENDMAFRIGGDEFAVILKGSHDEKFLESVIQRIKTSFARETVVKGNSFQLSASAGFARCPVDTAEFKEVIKIADTAMYEDKRKFHSENDVK